MWFTVYWFSNYLQRFCFSKTGTNYCKHRKRPAEQQLNNCLNCLLFSFYFWIAITNANLLKQEVGDSTSNRFTSTTELDLYIFTLQHMHTHVNHHVARIHIHLHYAKIVVIIYHMMLLKRIIHATITVTINLYNNMMYGSIPNKKNFYCVR